jgi:formylglycine-generating enzyme required for sulfatase activity
LDEIFVPEERARVTAAIEELVRRAPGGNRRDDRFLVTSRFQGYHDPGVSFGDDFFVLEIRPLDFDKSCEFIRHWFPEAEKAFSKQDADAVAQARRRGEQLIELLANVRTDYEQRARESAVRPSAGLLELIGIPLLLNILCAVYDEREDLPNNRVELYKLALELMFRRKSHERRLYSEETAIRALGEVAWWLNDQGDGVVGSYATMKERVTQALAHWKGQEGLDRDPDRFLQYIHQEVGLLAKGGANRREMSFLHRTFQEYLASRQALNNSLAGELAERAHTDRWREVVALSLRGSLVFKQQFFRALLKLDLPETNPSLMGYYLQETDELPVAEFDACLKECRKRGNVGEAKAVAVMRLAENAGFATLDQLPSLRLWKEDKTSPSWGLARSLLKLLQAAGLASVGGDGQERAMQLPSLADDSSRLMGTRWVHEGTKLSFVWIAPGRFRMGSEEGEGRDNEWPAHWVTLTQGFWLGEFPVTNAQYGRFLRARPKGVRAPGEWNNRRWNQPQQPVVSVSWLEAMAYCAWVSSHLQARCTLPTEAQWEYACRAGSKGPWCFEGNDESQLPEYAWYDKNSGGSTQPVGTRKPNRWGLYDMHGNVWEWSYDRYDEQPYRERTHGIADPVHGDQAQDGSADAQRVLRGCSWSMSAWHCRSAFRVGVRADFRFGSFGFRVALIPGPSPAPE